ncbi:hypothetical protein D9757_002956 [Collybiopsis confluens]|uniref:BTB domain-containing protein n=1 Tax=Collybiopsis confluens TaxID=2823264 RepID=A0A8H5MDU5_9AGAR|nr:hypothetical protein D9757_002956 [Collybiopsis confluens]
MHAGQGLFKIHRYFLERESTKFQELLSRPPATGQATIGSLNNPVVLNVTSEEFQQFLWIFYNPVYSYEEAKLGDWATILTVACRFKFPEVKKLAVRHLEQIDLDLVERISLYQECNADEDLLIPLYSQLCAREKTLSLAETHKLGYETAVMVFQAREHLRSPSDRGKSPLPDDIEEEEVEDTIRDLMKDLFTGDSNENRKSISANGWAAAYEDALASINMEPKSRSVRRIQRPLPPPAPTTGTPPAEPDGSQQKMETITEVSTLRTGRTNSIHSESGVDDRKRSKSPQMNGDSEEERSYVQEQPESATAEKVDSEHNYGIDIVAQRSRLSTETPRNSLRWSRARTFRTASTSSVPPVPGSWSEALAATLGSKSTFKKLPKRSVLGADIAQLCDLIAHPEEPLALRLSSNLMVVKQEIFMNDVTNCVSSLKKVVQEIQAPTKNASHQMAQQQPKVGAFTIAADPQAMYFLEFDEFITDWDEFLNLDEDATKSQNVVDEDDQEYSPDALSKSKKKKTAATNRPPSSTEGARADLVTLKEHHDYLLSNSFDLAFDTSQGGGDVAPHSEAIFHPEYDLFPGIDEGMDIDFGIGDDLARELGEGWGGSPVKNTNQDRMIISDPVQLDDIRFEMGQAQNTDFFLGVNDVVDSQNPNPLDADLSADPPNSKQSSENAFVQLLLSQDEQLLELEPTPLADVASIKKNGNKRKSTQKRTRLLLDSITELSNEELKIAQAQYLSRQHDLRRQLRTKQSERDGEKNIEKLIWAVPGGIEAPSLVDFWQENFRIQVEARTGLIHLDIPDQRGPPNKRRKLERQGEEDRTTDYDMRVDEPVNFELNQIDEGEIGSAGMDLPLDWNEEMQLRSSEACQPVSRLDLDRLTGMAGTRTRPSNVEDVGGDFNFDLHGQHEEQHQGSQRSSLYPWDNAGAGPSSSVDWVKGGSDRISINQAEIRMRGSSLSRRESSLALSHNGSADLRGISPGNIRIRETQTTAEDFLFSGGQFEISSCSLRSDTTDIWKVEPDDTQGMSTYSQIDSQKSDMNLVALERNSFNFLE